jgi:hypothetical protein
MGDIDIGGIPRFGTQSSANLSLRQDVFAFHGDIVHSRGRHLLKGGLLVERYKQDMFNPTFSLGIYTFPSLETFLRNRPQRFIGLTPEGDIERSWRFTLLASTSGRRRLGDSTLSGRAATNTRPCRKTPKGRDVSLEDLLDPQVTVGPLPEPDEERSPALRLRVGRQGDGRTSVREVWPLSSTPTTSRT